MRERLIGAAVLVIIAVILIPWLVSRAHHPENIVTRTSWPASANAPAQPYVLPLQSTVPTTSSVAAIPAPTTQTTDTSRTATAHTATAVAATMPSETKASATDNAVPTQPLVSHKSGPVKQKPASTSAGLTVPPAATPQLMHTGWSVQAASFSDIKAARILEKHLEKAGFKVGLAPHQVSETTYYRVLVGPYPSKTQARAAAPKIARISRTRVLIRTPGSGKE
ncbi:MAG: SPOR domain-containing protein [Gammaproteobacteria bacterium]